MNQPTPAEISTNSEEIIRRHYPDYRPENSTHLLAAIAKLDAEQTSDGHYTYYAAETSKTYRVTESDMIDLGKRLANDPDGIAYSLWCAETASETDLHGADCGRVTDACGGIWTPSDEAAEQIDYAIDPAAEAVRICDTEPMRGVWNS